MDRPCICSHSKASHHTRTFLSRFENWDFEDTCWGCYADEKANWKCCGIYKPMSNLEWLEMKAMEKIA